VLAAVTWNVVLFGLLRLPWTAVHLLWPLVGFQQGLVAAMGFSASRVFVSLECSGAEVMALCAAVLLSYPVAWRVRLAGAAGGVGLLLLANAIRIGILGRFVTSAFFSLLHLYVLPVILIVIAAGYAFAWMAWSMRGGGSKEERRPAMRARFFWVGGGFLAVYAAMTPWLLTSPLVRRAAGGAAYAAAILLNAAGVDSTAAGPLLTCGHAAYLVTSECILSPLLPLLLAAAVAASTGTLRRVVLVAAALSLFAAASVGRLLVLALPSSLVGHPMFLAHGFRQLLLGLGVVAVAAWACEPSAALRVRTVWRAVLAVLVSVVVAAAVAPFLGRLLASVTRGVALTPPHDEQGALALLPTYQVALLTALLLVMRVRPGIGVLALAAVVVSQLGLFRGLRELALRSGELASPTPVRAWAVAVPLVLAFVAARLSRRGGRSYLRFWQNVGERFPDLGGAASTEYYRQNEQRLLDEHLPLMPGARLFKTDLWDEAKNTRILQWAQQRGARVYGVDISEPTLRQARAEFGAAALGAAVGDVRRLPFRDGVFDGLYSMGTIEHFRDFDVAVAEIFRVVRPGGRAIVGVPNRHDPFLRPLLVAALSAVGLYDYGYERSFSRRALRELLERAGFEVVDETAILFIPGWLRMLDLWCYTRARPLSRVTGVAVGLFRWLDRRLPAVRRHGYLLATVVSRPVTSATTRAQ
jgi:exosortase/archaeosortase family protein